MKVLLCGGGTAGHVMPAIAIAEILEKEFPDVTVAFAGRVNGSENSAYSKTKHRLYTVDICGIKRSLNIRNFKSFAKILKSGKAARRIIKEFQPDVIIGTGGYVCFPFLRQGQRMGIRTVMHESNVAPGLVTRILGPKCDKLLLNLDGTKKYLKRKDNTLVVGNPTRKSFGAITRSEARRRLSIPDGKRLIVSFGGSLGADTLNTAILGFIEGVVLRRDDIFHIHATGRQYYKQISESHSSTLKQKQSIRILPYIEDMPTVLRAADIAITRSGAITVSELSKCATPSILIPSPNVTANHQFINAEYMVSKGAAIVIEEKDLTPQRLSDEVISLLTSRAKMHRMSVCAKNVCVKDTDALIVSAIREIIAQ